MAKKRKPAKKRTRTKKTGSSRKNKSAKAKKTSKSTQRAPKKAAARRAAPPAKPARPSKAAQRGGDYQGASRAERADSESVEELLEEGNTFEAGAVAGVEAADDEDEHEVRTHEVPEDDVPGEYRDED